MSEWVAYVDGMVAAGSPPDAIRQDLEQRGWRADAAHAIATARCAPGVAGTPVAPVTPTGGRGAAREVVGAERAERWVWIAFVTLAAAGVATVAYVVARNGRGDAQPAALLAVGAGAFSLLGGLLDWDWFIKSERAWIFVKVLRRTGARIFYMLLGMALVVGGALGVLGALG